MTALAAGLGAALAAGPEQAKAQATALILPHPDGEIAVDVSQVAFETQAQILEQLGACLQEGFEFADEDGNGAIEGDEQFDWDDERGFCAESAQNDFVQASLEEEIRNANAEQAELDENIRLANAEQAALRARADEARQRISDLTEEAMQDIANGS